VARALKDQVDVWLVAGFDAPRGATAVELAQVLREEKIKGEVELFATVTDALRHACNAAAENGDCDTLLRSSSLREQPPDTLSRASRFRAPFQECRIVAFGSFYTVADVMRARGLRGG
jgi:dihydrofolate synthase/folylpolyglutamate synthase